ncbi:MAG: hypothetical protein WCH99_10200 [Verrucomicrobiota bacterium]
MGKTYRTSSPIPAALQLNPERACKESTVRRFAKAWKKITHHRERRSLRTAIMNELQEAV